MTDFEIMLTVLIVPAAYLIIHIAGKYDILALIPEMPQQKTKDLTHYSATEKAYKILVDARDNGTDFDMDEVIGYLGEALE